MSGSQRRMPLYEGSQAKESRREERGRNDGSRIYTGGPSRGSVPETSSGRLRGLVGGSQVTS